MRFSLHSPSYSTYSHKCVAGYGSTTVKARSRVRIYNGQSTARIRVGTNLRSFQTVHLQDGRLPRLRIVETSTDSCFSRIVRCPGLGICVELRLQISVQHSDKVVLRSWFSAQTCMHPRNCIHVLSHHCGMAQKHGSTDLHNSKPRQL